MPCICARLLKPNSFGCWIQTAKVWRKSASVKQTSCTFLEACTICAPLLHYRPLPCSGCTGENVSETSSCVRVTGTLAAAFAAGLLRGGRSGWLNHSGRRSSLQLTSFWQLCCPLCIMRCVFDCVMDPTGDVSSEQSSGCLTGFANFVHLVGHTGWAPLRRASNQDFCLFRVMYPHGVCSFRHPTRQSHLCAKNATEFILQYQARKMDIQFD